MPLPASVDSIQEMNTVLKKAGIVVAAAAAGLLAVSPLAFAGDYDGDHDGDHDGGGHSHHHAKKADCEQDNSSKNGDTEQRGLVNLNNTTVQVPIQACDNHVGILDGAFGILGKAENKQVND
jgi:hypothetical protein